MMCFSVIKNTEQIIGMKKKPGDLPALDGIRVITCTWVILGHLLQLLFYTMGTRNKIFFVFSKKRVCGALKNKRLFCYVTRQFIERQFRTTVVKIAYSIMAFH